MLLHCLRAGVWLASPTSTAMDIPDYLLYKPTTHETGYPVSCWSDVSRGQSRSDVGERLAGSRAGDFNGNGNVDLVLYRPSTHQTVIWYLNNNVRVGSASGPTLPDGWSVVAVADFNGDGHPDYVLFKPTTDQSVIWYLSGAVRIGSRTGPTILRIRACRSGRFRRQSQARLCALQFKHTPDSDLVSEQLSTHWQCRWSHSTRWLELNRALSEL